MFFRTRKKVKQLEIELQELRNKISSCDGVLKEDGDRLDNWEDKVSDLYDGLESLQSDYNELENRVNDIEYNNDSFVDEYNVKDIVKDLLEEPIDDIDTLYDKVNKLEETPEMPELEAMGKAFIEFIGKANALVEKYKSNKEEK